MSGFNLTLFIDMWDAPCNIISIIQLDICVMIDMQADSEGKNKAVADTILAGLFLSDG